MDGALWYLSMDTERLGGGYIRATGGAVARSRALVVVSKAIRWPGIKYCLSEYNDSRLAASSTRR
ncbi:hypothetical protein IG631_14368 [Alternaria alternata]|jgi:hypothetical protein|nr:hypothetical protein IG631_14368 [Alternaria alternata]